MARLGQTPAMWQPPHLALRVRDRLPVRLPDRLRLRLRLRVRLRLAVPLALRDDGAA